MSPRTRDLPRRSCHAVPASNPRFIERAQTLAADMVFLDLEDSVAPARKEEARAAAAEAVRVGDWGDTILCVRVNSWSTRWTVADLTEVVVTAGPRLDEVMLPKVESAAQVVAADLVLRQAELAAGLPVGHLGLEIQIESAEGVANVDQICAASSRLEAVAFGPADFAASMHMPTVRGGVPSVAGRGDEFTYALSRILVAARVNGLQVIDGPYLDIDDHQGLRKYSQRVHSFGLDGKWTVHPGQIAVVNEVFTPTRDQYERAVAVVDACERAAAGGDGAVRFEGEMIDEASRQMAVRLVHRGERCGFGRSLER